MCFYSHAVAAFYSHSQHGAAQHRTVIVLRGCTVLSLSHADVNSHKNGMAGSALLDSYSTERWASTLIGLKSSIYWKYTESVRESESQPATHQQQSAVAKTYNNNSSSSINNHYNNKLIARTKYLQLYSSYANGAHRARRSGKKTFRMVHSSLVVTWMSVIFISVMCLFDSSSSFCWLRVMLCENRATWSVCLCQFYKRPEKYFFFFHHRHRLLLLLLLCLRFYK